MKLLLVGLAFAFALVTAGCATVPPGATPAGPCGDPCGRLACPSAFTCVVDAHCGARCQPEAIKPGLP